jgi:hypothetical protein
LVARLGYLRLLGSGIFRARLSSLEAGVASPFLHQRFQAFLFAHIAGVPSQFSCNAINVPLVDVRTSKKRGVTVFRRDLPVWYH